MVFSNSYFMDSRESFYAASIIEENCSETRSSIKFEYVEVSVVYGHMFKAKCYQVKNVGTYPYELVVSYFKPFLII